jgi:hypothetical protein
MPHRIAVQVSEACNGAHAQATPRGAPSGRRGGFGVSERVNLRRARELLSERGEDRAAGVEQVHREIQ